MDCTVGALLCDQVAATTCKLCIMSEGESKKSKFAPKHRAKEYCDGSSDAVDVIRSSSSAVKPKDAKAKVQRLFKGSKTSSSRENIERVPFYRPVVEKKSTKGRTKETAAEDQETSDAKMTKGGKKGIPSPTPDNFVAGVNLAVGNEVQGVENNEHMDVNDEFDLYVTSDEEDMDVEMNNNDDSMIAEEWPRKRHAHNQMPLMLPIGPRTLALRSKDLQRSIIGPFSEKEELLLVQLPSELGLLPQTRADGDECPVIETGQPLPSGKLGKMQVLESGKVFFLTEGGVKYDVSNGMPCYFLQCLAVIDLPNALEDESVLSSSQPGGGEFGVVGTIKRKLVVSQSDDSIEKVEDIADVLSVSL